MKTIKIIGRAEIINCSMKRIHDDVGLMALDGYRSETFQVEDSYDKGALISEFERKHPEVKGGTFEVIELQADTNRNIP